MSEIIKELRWPGGRLAGDYLRASAGIAVTMLFAFLAPWGTWWQIFVLLLLALFVTFLIDVLIRHGTRIMLTADGLIRQRPVWGEDRVSWSAIEGLDVRFYATRRDRKQGWLTATVKGAGSTISLDDAMPGFEDVMDRAMQALNAKGLGMNETTSANLSSLGLGLRPRARK